MLPFITGIAPDRKAMLSPLIHNQLELALLLLREDGLDLLHSRPGKRHIATPVRDAERLLHGLDVVGQGQHAGMRREPCIDQTLAVGRFLGVVAQERDVFTAPAEAGRSDGETGAFVLPKGFEEVEDPGFRDRLAVVVHEWGEVICGSGARETVHALGQCIMMFEACWTVKYIFIMFPRIPWLSAITLSMVVNRSGVHEFPSSTSTRAL